MMMEIKGLLLIISKKNNFERNKDKFCTSFVHKIKTCQMKIYLSHCISIFYDFRKVIGALFIILFIVYFSSCQKAQSYSSTPEISLKGYTIVDTIQIIEKDTNKIRMLTLKFNFTDGDGNLSDGADRLLVSLSQDTSQAKVDTTTYSKIYLKFYEKKLGMYIPVSDSSFKTPPAYPIPYGDAMSREGQNKTEKGVMEVFYPFYYLAPTYTLPFDTIRIDLYIEDLAFQKSNVISFIDIPVTRK